MRRGRAKKGASIFTCSWRFCDLAAFSPSLDPDRRLPPWLWLWLVMVAVVVTGPRLDGSGGAECLCWQGGRGEE